MAAPVSPAAPVGLWLPVCGMLLDAEVHQNHRLPSSSAESLRAENTLYNIVPRSPAPLLRPR